MTTKMIEVHPDFKIMLQNTQKYIEEITDKKISMEELTRILSEPDGNRGVMSIKFPVILIPEKIVKGRPKKEGSIWNKYINILLEDRPR
jgi:hypothetical protein